MMRAWIVMGCVVLGGCASTPPHYYTLSSPQAAQALADASGVAPYALNAVTVPAQVDRNAIVVQQKAGHLLLLSDDLWSAPLGAQLQTALSQGLEARLGRPPVQNLAVGARDSKVTQIFVDVQRFDMVPGQHVALSAAWRVQFPGGKPTFTCFTRLTQPVEVGVTPLVLGQQRNVQELSQQIAQMLMRRAAPQGASCQ
jgi:uncharacterized lipoprotein YmbA